MLLEKDGLLTRDQIERLGNTAIFFAENTYELTKTKLLKLVYLCEEYHVKKYASPFLGLPFHAWKFGPVQKELWVNLDAELIEGKEQEKSSILSDYVTVDRDSQPNNQIVALRKFCDDEFSDDDIAIMTQIAKEHKYTEARHLVFITHKDYSLWYKTVSREVGLLERFETQIQSTSDIVLDFSELLENPKAKEFYRSQMDLMEFNNSLK